MRAALAALGVALIGPASAIGAETVRKNVKTTTEFSAVKAADGTITAVLTYKSKDRHCLDDARFELPHASIGGLLLRPGPTWEVGDPPGGADVGWEKTSLGVYQRVVPPGGTFSVRPQGGGPVTTFQTQDATSVVMVGSMLTYKTTYKKGGKKVKLTCGQFTDSQELPI